jgi:hypothetical protein
MFGFFASNKGRISKYKLAAGIVFSARRLVVEVALRDTSAACALLLVHP